MTETAKQILVSRAKHLKESVTWRESQIVAHAADIDKIRAILGEQLSELADLLQDLGMAVAELEGME